MAHTPLWTQAYTQPSVRRRSFSSLDNRWQIIGPLALRLTHKCIACLHAETVGRMKCYALFVSGHKNLLHRFPRIRRFSIPQSAGQTQLSKAGTVSGCKTTIALNQKQTHVNLRVKRGVIEEFLRKTKNPHRSSSMRILLSSL